MLLPGLRLAGDGSDMRVCRHVQAVMAIVLARTQVRLAASQRVLALSTEHIAVSRDAIARSAALLDPGRASAT